jgi:hypothetical protein
LCSACETFETTLSSAERSEGSARASTAVLSFSFFPLYDLTD